MITHDKLEDLVHELEQAKSSYLKRFGWELTCNAPGAYWVWRRDFTKEDNERIDNWRDRGPGPMGWPSRPNPYGVITAPTDLAVSMTHGVLDLVDIEPSEEHDED